MILHFFRLYPFIHLFEKGFEKVVRMLIESKANVNATNDNNSSAVIFAAQNGKISNVIFANFV